MSEPLSMPEILLPEKPRNGRPFNSHDRHLDGDPARNVTADYARSLHIEHVQDYDALCMVCGCCWCCDDDCCAEYICPNLDCGCSDKPQPTRVTSPAKCDECGGSQVVEIGLPDIYRACPTCVIPPAR